MTEENDKTLEDREPESTEGGALTFTSIVMSTLAAAIGVQSKRTKSVTSSTGQPAPLSWPA
jgi:hypothetical protein